MALNLYLALILLPSVVGAVPVLENVIGNRVRTQEFTTSGTFTRPSGFSFFNVLCIGGGGGGANDSADDGAGGGGGEIVFKQVYITSNVYVSIGAGGGATANGSPTAFGNLLTARGGYGATNLTAGSQFAKGGTAATSGNSYDVSVSSPHLSWSPISYAAGGVSSVAIGGGGGGGFLGGSISGNGGIPTVSGTYGSGGGGETDNNGVAGSGGNGYCVVWW